MKIVGLRLPSSWYLLVQHGEASIIRAGRGMESPERRGHASLSCLHVPQLDVCLIGAHRQT